MNKYYNIYEKYIKHKLLGGIKTSYNNPNSLDIFVGLSPNDIIDLLTDLMINSTDASVKNYSFILSKCINTIKYIIEFIKFNNKNKLSININNDIDTIKNTINLYKTNIDDYCSKVYNESSGNLYYICEYYISNLMKNINLFNVPFDEHISKLIQLNDKNLDIISSFMNNFVKYIDSVFNIHRYSNILTVRYLIPSITECLIVLLVNNIDIKFIDYISNGTFNIVYRVKLCENNVELNEKYVIRLYKHNKSLTGTSIYNKKRLDSLFSDIDSYPIPKHANYQFDKVSMNRNDVTWTMWSITKEYNDYPSEIDTRMRDIGINQNYLIDKFEYLLTDKYEESSNKNKEEHEQIRLNNICRYIDQMSQIIFRLHENTNYVYIDWKIDNIALDEYNNFILIDNDFQEINENQYYIHTYKYNMLSSNMYNLNSILNYNKKDIAQAIDKIILLTELCIIYKCSSRRQYVNIVQQSYSSIDDYRSNLNEILNKIDQKSYPNCYNLIKWYLDSGIKKVS